MSLGRLCRLSLGGSIFSSVRANVRAVTGPRWAEVGRSARALSHVPVDDLISGLTEEQVQVAFVLPGQLCVAYQGDGRN